MDQFTVKSPIGSSTEDSHTYEVFVFSGIVKPLIIVLF
jgi:hypothetical protein